MTSLKWRRYIERHVTLFGATKTLQLVHTVIQRKTCFFTTIYISFEMQSVCFLVFYQIFPYIGSSGKRHDIYKTDFYSKMSEISNIVCRWVKTMSEILKSRGIHAHGNFVFGFSNILFSCKKQTKGHEVNLTAIPT